MQKHLPKEVLEAQAIYVSHSGGKDSQAMLAQLVRLGLKDKLVIVHSDLGDMEWEEMKPWIEKNSFGLPVHVVSAGFSFWELCRKWGRLPSGRQQFCTDHLKTQPIKEFIHDHMYKNGITKAINATGMRASESPRRAKKAPFILSRGKGTSGMDMPRKHPTHTIYDWLPIFRYSDQEVHQEIKNAGQEVHHVYGLGFSRLSCVFCVNGRIGEHKKAAQLRPDIFEKMAKLEEDLGKTLRLKQRKGIKYPKFLREYITA